MAASYFILPIMALVMLCCEKQGVGDSSQPNLETPPEETLGVSIKFDSDDPATISIEEARTRSRPVLEALSSPDLKKAQAAAKLISDGFYAGNISKPSKYTMMGYALRTWVAFAAFPPGPKPERDLFIAAVNSAIGLVDKGNRKDALGALFLFLDLELEIQGNENSKSLLLKWKISETYRQLTNP